MTKPKQEKRAVPRTSWKLPASLKASSRARARVELRDVSSRGLFFFTDSKLQEQSKVEIVLMMPPEVEPFGRQWVCCQATVVRVEQEKPDKLGVAAVINRCEALPQI
jgi:hypothetical protein